MLDATSRSGMMEFSCATKRAPVPRPDEVDLEHYKLVLRYMLRPSEDQGMSYLGWLHAYRTATDALQRYRRVRGQRVALKVFWAPLSSDAFAGQCLVAYKPFRATAGLTRPAQGRVPRHLTYFAAMHRFPEVFQNKAGKRLSARKPRALRFSFQTAAQWWNITKHIHVCSRWRQEEPLTPDQQAAHDMVWAAVCQKDAQAIAVLGKAGTGKSHEREKQRARGPAGGGANGRAIRIRSGCRFPLRLPDPSFVLPPSGAMQ